MTDDPADARTAHRTHVSYIDKSRDYYAAHGYEHPYRWPVYHSVPFSPLSVPLSRARVGVVTTASPMLDRSDAARRGRKRSYAAPASPPPEAMYTDDLSWDKEATTTDDPGSFLPLAHLEAAVAAGRIGSVAPRYYGVPTDYSQRRTREVDAPEIVAWCREDEVDLILLVPL